MSEPKRIKRREVMVGTLAASAVAALPWRGSSRARALASARGPARHLLYLHLEGGFRFPVAFNARVAAEHNPFGASAPIPGVEWTAGRLLAQSGWLTAELRALGVRPFVELAKDVAVLASVDHEPGAPLGDGFHAAGLERVLTGFRGGRTGLLTSLNRELDLPADGRHGMPAVVLGAPGMGAAEARDQEYGAPVLGASGFHLAEPAPLVDSVAYYRTGAAIAWRGSSYDARLLADALHDERFGGASNRELTALLGDDRAADETRKALRLIQLGSPAVFVEQGNYDLHEDEERLLPPRIAALSRLLAGLHRALRLLEHPAGGSCWDHTIVVLGSEFSRTSRGAGFNLARGSDHGRDMATRIMSMPVFGGPVRARGRQLGATRPSDLAPEGRAISYRSVMATLMAAVGAHDPALSREGLVEELVG